MKGINEIKLYLGSGNSLSVQVAKDILPSTEVDRDALFHVLIEQQKELATFRAASVVTERSEPKASTSTSAATSVVTEGSTSSELNAASQSFVPAAQNTNGNAGGRMPVAVCGNAGGRVPAAQNTNGNTNARVNTTEEPEREEGERLCRSMWGYKECPRSNGQECERKHLPICDKPTCYSSTPDQWKLCQESTQKWHGHIKASHVMQKKRERLEAKNRKQEAEQKEYSANRKAFIAWTKNQGNGRTPSARGKPWKKTQEGLSAQSLKNKENPRGQRRPAARRLGDFLPKRDFPPLPQRGGHPTYQPAPKPTKPAWTKAGTAQQEVLPGAREQIQDLLKGISMLLRQGAF